MPMMLRMNSGDVLEVVRMFGVDRALVWLEPGVPVIAVLKGGAWDAMTGEPARPGEELDALNALLADAGTTVTVTDPSGATTTFEDP